MKCPLFGNDEVFPEYALRQSQAPIGAEHFNSSLSGRLLPPTGLKGLLVDVSGDEEGTLRERDSLGAASGSGPPRIATARGDVSVSSGNIPRSISGDDAGIGQGYVEELPLVHPDTTSALHDLVRRDRTRMKKVARVPKDFVYGPITKRRSADAPPRNLPPGAVLNRPPTPDGVLHGDVGETVQFLAGVDRVGNMLDPRGAGSRNDDDVVEHINNETEQPGIKQQSSQYHTVE